MNRYEIVCSAAVAALGLSGCASTAPTATVPPGNHPAFVRASLITRNVPAYLAAHFSPAQLPPGVRAEITRAGPVTLPFHTLVVTRQFVRHVTLRDVNVKILVTDTLTNIGGGYLQGREQLSFNTIPVALNLNLSYLGLMSLEHQNIDYRTGLARAPMRLQQLLALTPGVAHPEPGKTYRLTLRWLRGRITDTCKAAPRFYPARRLLAQLPGRALNLKCAISRNGVVRSRNRTTYLSAYGIFLIMKRRTAAFTARAKILSIRGG